MATLSLAPPNPTHLFSTHGRPKLLLHPSTPPFSSYGSSSSQTPPHLGPISAAKLPPRPPSSPHEELYQPFRPPASPLLPQYRSLGLANCLEVLHNQLSLWYEYMLLIPSLFQDGFTPPSIKDIIGISGVEQNRLIVTVQVRDSLVSSNVDVDLLAYFDVGGAELLYELRLLNAGQRAVAARQVAVDRFDAKATQELTQAIKDFPRCRGDQGWESFSGESPADCLAYTFFRLNREAICDADRRAALEKAMKEAETDGARKRIEEELEKKAGEESRENGVQVPRFRVPVVRMRYGEVAEATSVVVLPVCEAREGKEGVTAAPGCRAEGEFAVVTTERPWRRWVVLPRWESVAGIEEGWGVAVAFVDARWLPWQANRWKEEAVLVVAYRGRKEVVEAEGFYLVSRVGGGEGGLAVDRGSKLLELEAKEALGTVVLVVRPPKDEGDDQLQVEDWE